MGYLRRVHGVTLRDKIRGCEIRKTLNGQPCILRIERSGIYKDGLARHDLLASPKGKWPRYRPRTRWHDCVSNLVWSCLGGESAERYGFAVDSEIFWVHLGLLPPRPSPEEKMLWKRINKLLLLLGIDHGNLCPVWANVSSNKI